MPSGDEQATALPRRRRWIGWSVWVCAALLFIGLTIQPISTGLVRLTQVVSLLLLLAVPLWKHRGSRWSWGVSAALGLMLVVTALWPSPADAGVDQDAYLRALRHYEGTSYVWGAEGHAGIGIDCSGLARRAMVDTLRRKALAHGDPSAVREAVDLWWHDRSADALGDGYRGDTVTVGAAKSLNTFDHVGLRPGDLGVSGCGRHVLIYLGEKEWIAADWPVVSRWTAEQTDNYWFTVPIRFVRWRWLADR